MLPILLQVQIEKNFAEAYFVEIIKLEILCYSDFLLIHCSFNQVGKNELNIQKYFVKTIDFDNICNNQVKYNATEQNVDSFKFETIIRS